MVKYKINSVNFFPSKDQHRWIHCLLTVWIVLQLALFTLLSSYKQTHPIPGCQVEIFVDGCVGVQTQTPIIQNCIFYYCT